MIYIHICFRINYVIIFCQTVLLSKNSGVSLAKKIGEKSGRRRITSAKNRRKREVFVAQLRQGEFIRSQRLIHQQWRFFGENWLKIGKKADNIGQKPAKKRGFRFTTKAGRVYSHTTFDTPPISRCPKNRAFADRAFGDSSAPPPR